MYQVEKKQNLEHIKDVEKAMKNLKKKEIDDNNNSGHGNGTKVPKTSDDFHILIQLAGMLGAIKVISGRRK